MNTRVKRIAWLSGGLLALTATGASLVHIAGAGASSEGPLPAAKQDRLDAEEARRAGAPRAPKPTDPAVERPPGNGGPVWELGIVEEDESPSRDYTVLNRWAGVVDGRTVVVFAGSRADDPGAGAVIVAIASDDGSFSQVRPLLAPPGSGSIRITGVQGSVLTLASSGGSELHFDVATQRFV